VSTHRKVIAYIHLGYRDKRFAIWELRAGSGASNSSVTRTLVRLVELKLVKHYATGFKGKNYEVTKSWHPDVMKVIEVFELAKALNI